MRFLLIGIFLMLVCISVFGIGFNVGGGINNIGILGIGVNFPTLTAGLNIPILNELSIIGNFETLFSPSTTSSNSLGAQIMFLGTGGLQYTFGSTSSIFRPFVGLDGGMLFGISSSGFESYFVFGPNGGINVQISKLLGFYAKMAYRMLVISSQEISLTLNIIELTGGVNFNF